MSLVLQSIIFPKNKYTKKQAEAYLLKHNYKIKFYGKGVDETINYYRYRQASPLKFKKDKYITKKLNNGIQLILGYLI